MTPARTRNVDETKPDEERPTGHVYVDVAVRALDRRRKSTTFRCLVDTGATDTFLPTKSLIQLGIKPHGKRDYELADGQIVTYDAGHAVLRFENEEVATDVNFGPSGTEPILGVVALESTGFVVDPRTQRLRKVKAIPLKAAVVARNHTAAACKRSIRLRRAIGRD